MSIFLQIDSIDGDVSAKGHESWIALEALDFNVKRLLSTDPGRIADREGTRPIVSEVTITKKMDKSSPYLFGEACVGKAKSEVKIDICQTGNNLNPYAQLTLSNVIVSSFDINAMSSNPYDSTKPPYPMETVTLNFDKIELRYTPYNNQNQPQSPIPAGYDLQAAIAT